jgi:hypothetical protein
MYHLICFLFLIVIGTMGCDTSTNIENQREDIQFKRMIPQKADDLVEVDQSNWVRLLKKDVNELPFVENELLNEIYQQTQSEMKISREMNLNHKGIYSQGKILSNFMENHDLQLRTDDLSFIQDIHAFRFLGLDGFSHVPFSFKSKQKIQVTRVFESEQEALSAKTLMLNDLPFTVALAQKLEEGTLVDIPLEAMLSINASHDWLSKVFNHQEDFKDFLSLSSLTHLKGSAQGLLLIKGFFRLQVYKINRDWVRIRFLVDQRREASAQVSLGVNQNLKAVFIPATRLDKLKNAYLQLSTLSKKPEQWFKTIDQRMNELKYLLSQGSRQMSDFLPQENEHYQTLLDLIDTQDEILEIIEQGQIRLEDLNQILMDQTNRIFGRVDQTIRSSIAQIESYTRKNLNFNLSIQLNQKLVEEFFFLSDFNIDLSSQDGAMFYNDLFTGTFWQGINPIQFFGEDGLQKIDISLIEDAAKHSSAIILNQTLSGFSKIQKNELSLNSPIISSKFSDRKINKTLKREEGNITEEYQYEYWERERSLNGIFFDEGESVSCGVIERTSSNDQNNSFDRFYWMIWDRKWSDFEPNPLIKSLDESINLLGPLANVWQIPQLYYEDLIGASHSELKIIFHQKLLNAIFDLDEVMLWKILAEVAQYFNNQFGLPYLTAWQAPSLDEQSAQYCDVIARHWGLKYCHIFNDTLIIPLRMAKEQGKHLDFDFQKEILKSFYSKIIVNNWTASKLVTRFLSNAGNTLGLAQEIVFSFKYQHPLLVNAVTVDQIGQYHESLDLLEMIK